MKRLSQFVCLVTVLAMLIVVPAYATEQTERSSSFFSAYRAYCYAASSTKMEVRYSVIATSDMDELGVSSIKVQQSSDGSNWTTVKTFTKEVYSQLIDTNTAFHGGSVSYPRTSGYYYRAYVTFYAKNSTGTGYYFYYTDKI